MMLFMSHDMEQLLTESMLAASLIATAASSTSPRTRSCFDDSFHFHLGGPTWNLGNTSCPNSHVPCSPSFDDASWRHNLRVPHDFVVEQPINKSFDPNHGARATSNAWYRKTFDVPSKLRDSLTWLTFDGVFRDATVFVNGAVVAQHVEGYTSFRAWLHNASIPLRYGAGGANLLAVYLDATQPELWCYEGGGIYRHVWLESAGKVSVVPHGFHAPTVILGAISGTDPRAAQTTDSAGYFPRLDIANAGSKPAAIIVRLTIIRLDASKAVLLNATLPPATVGAYSFLRVEPGFGDPRSELAVPLSFGSRDVPVDLWNIAREPPLYAAAAIVTDAATGDVLDVVTVRIGVRDAVFDANRGFLLNGAQVKIKGTANHLGFGGVGVALPDRVVGET